MGIVNRIRVASTFRVRRKHDHPDWTIPCSTLIPGDEDDATVFVRL